MNWFSMIYTHNDYFVYFFYFPLEYLNVGMFTLGWLSIFAFNKLPVKASGIHEHKPIQDGSHLFQPSDPLQSRMNMNSQRYLKPIIRIYLPANFVVSRSTIFP